MREQFNLENFLAGKYERVETREGKEVLQLAYFSMASDYQLAGIIDDGWPSLENWTQGGLYYTSQNDSDHDLFGILKPQQ